jgi:hypothetical protein
MIAFGATYELSSDVPVTRFRKNKSDAEIIKAATMRLLKGNKAKAAKNGKPLRRGTFEARL